MLKFKSWSFEGCGVTHNYHYSHNLLAKNKPESTREPINYGRFINQFQPDIITSIWQLEMINIKICRQNNVYILQSNMP